MPHQAEDTTTEQHTDRTHTGPHVQSGQTRDVANESQPFSESSASSWKNGTQTEERHEVKDYKGPRIGPLNYEQHCIRLGPSQDEHDTQRRMPERR